MMSKQKQLDAQIVICGRGGQGVLFLTRLLDEAAVSLGCNVISSETHGMAMRGGSVASHIRIGAYESPLIAFGAADILLAINELEAPFNMHLMKMNAQIYINAAARKQRCVQAEKIARQLGSPVITNLVLLGFACAHHEFPFTYAHLCKVLQQISPPRSLDLNLKAFTQGFDSITY
jgi:indolepyruvate ferredoxin oxidoreductase, beta subunit